ncbi:hypothetical protein J9303_17395 [Bacillaceae bacterium Marseille-Q3522]|nr:hypothetical protein [Bacillaceae bacterium Marseille-Q3522]
MEYAKIEKYYEQYMQSELSYWLNNSWNTPAWWVLLAALILPWVLWGYFVEKKRKQEIFTYGLIWISFTLILDMLGCTFFIWDYPRCLVPALPIFLPADVAVIPVSFMFVYQYSKGFLNYLCYTILLSGLYSFIVEWVFENFNLFKRYHWYHFYSFIGFVITALLIRAIHIKICK